MSIREEFCFDAADGVRLLGYAWRAGAPDQPGSPQNEPRPENGVVLILHGMAEHCGRYDEFAGFLADAGWRTYAVDLRGHGRTGLASGGSGRFADGGGWLTVLGDVDGLVDELEVRHAGLPVFLMGHSMGSFIARVYAARHGAKLAGLILSGTGTTPRPATRAGLLVAAGLFAVQEPRNPSRVLHAITFGGYSRSIRNRRTEFDWLSRDRAEVDKYIADPFCGKVFSLGFFIDLLKLVLEKDRPRNFRSTPKDLPIYIFSGTGDPVGNYSRGVLTAFSRYQKAGVKDLRIKLYQDGRHEMLNEINKKEVYRDVLDWLASHRAPAEAAQSPSSPA